MKATYKDLYKKKNQETGVVSTVFRYLLSGSPDELKRYKSVLEGQGIPVHTDEATKKMIFFETVYHGKVTEVIITDNDKIVVPDNVLDMMQSQLKLATDPAVKSAMAQAIADHMLKKILGSGTAPVASSVETVDPAEADLGKAE